MGRWRVRGTAVMTLSGVLACGPQIRTDTGAGESDADGGSGDTGAVDGASAENTGAGETATVDDTTGDETGAPSEPGLCGARADELLAIAVAEQTMHVIHGDGSAFVVDVSATAAPVGSHTSYGVAVGPDRIVVTSSWAFVDAGITTGATLRVLALDGTMQWQHEELGAGLSQPSVGHDGTIVVRRDPDDGDGHTVLMSAPGRETAFPGLSALGPLRPDDRIAGRMTEVGMLGPPGWMDATTGVFQPVSLVPLDTWYGVWDDALLYRMGTGIVVERPDAQDVIDLGASADLFPQSINGDWLLLGDSEGQWARASLTSSTAEPVTPGPPPTGEPFGCYSQRAAIDDSGGLYFTTRDATAARAFRYDPARRTWSPVGSPVTEIDSMDLWAAGQTVLVQTAGPNTTFCPPQVFDPAPGVLSGAHVQIVRASDGIEHLLPGEVWSAGLDATGVCATYTSARGTTLLDVVTGDTLPLPDSAVYYLR